TSPGGQPSQSAPQGLPAQGSKGTPGARPSSSRSSVWMPSLPLPLPSELIPPQAARRNASTESPRSEKAFIEKPPLRPPPSPAERLLITEGRLVSAHVPALRAGRSVRARRGALRPGRQL